MAGIETFEMPVQVVSALQEHGCARTFGLVLFFAGVNSTEKRVNGATGVGIRIGARYFIATAGHNLVGVPDAGLVLVHEDKVSYQPTPFVRRSPSAHDPEPNPDVGYIEISSDVARGSPKQFVPLAQVRTHFNQVGVSAVLVGHPVEHVPKDLLQTQKLINLRAMPIATKTIELPSDRDSDSEFALAVHDTGVNVETGEHVTTPSLVGISGGGVWTFPRPSSSGLWSPSAAQLVGLEHSWLKGRAILCVQMQHWLALVARGYPDLADDLAAAQQSGCT